MERIDNKFIDTLEKRFKANMDRHPTIKWELAKSYILNNKDLYDAIYAMEATGGEPDLVDLEVFRGLVYVDLAKESPKGRRSLCYDQKAREDRKENPSESSVEEEIEKMGLRLLDEEEYLALCQIADIDTRSSSWIQTPEDIRNAGGALFASKKYGRVFIFHNGAGSYYRSRGFRAYIKI